MNHCRKAILLWIVMVVSPVIMIHANAADVELERIIMGVGL